ncbi:hypothetical protein Bca101_074477 [Brassica carinata]
MLLLCTPPHGIVHTFHMRALTGQAQPRAVHPGAVWHPGSGSSVHHRRRCRGWWRWWRILGRPRWYGVVPCLCGGFTIGQLTPIGVTVTLQFCQERCIHHVRHFHWVPILGCTLSSAFCLAGGLRRRPGDPSCRSRDGRSWPCNSGILGRHSVDK